MSPADARPLYRRVLGERDWAALPPVVRRMHEADVAGAVGTAQVERGGHPLAGLIAGLFGFPRAGRDVPVRVWFAREGETEVWRRNFAGRRFTTRQQAAGAGLKIERFGPVVVALAMELDGERLHLRARRWTVFGLPLPAWLTLTNLSYETVEDGRFAFFDDVSHPWIGPIVRYRGWLEPEGAA